MEKNEMDQRPPPYSPTAYPPPHLSTETTLQMPMPGAPYPPFPSAPGPYPPPPQNPINDKIQTQPHIETDPSPYPRQEYTAIITQPPPVTHVHVITPVTGTGSCPVCHTGHFTTAFTTCGWICGIVCFPCGIICCMCCMKKKRCNHCGYTVA